MKWSSICCTKFSRNENEDRNHMLEIETEQGKLEGIICNTDTIDYIAFKGIPYAEPPIGKLRFKAPQPPLPWDGIREAVQHGPVCPQFNERMNNIEEGNEDCLYLNVYIPKDTPNPVLPVMVWIHGGGFYTGSGNSDFYNPEFFMAQNVILVTFNYRLEVLGFLCLDTEEVPGNAGLKDQVAALSWVQKNIANFKGDPNNVTIFGCSAGSASVSYHLMSKMSEGLFNKAICQSGVLLNEWAYNIYACQRAYQLGEQLGEDTKDPKKLLKFLRSVPVKSLVNIKLPPLEVKNLDIADGIFFGPVVEWSELKGEHFITESPPDVIRQGNFANVPIIVGYTSAEGIEIARKLPDILPFMSTVGAVVPREIKMNLPDAKVQIIDDMIRQHFFNQKGLSLKMLQEYSNLESERSFCYNIRRFAKHVSKHNDNPVFLYKFTAETERNYCKMFYKMKSLKGVCHADELHYLFNVQCIDIPLTYSKEIIQKFVQLWTNFAEKGDPSLPSEQKWAPFTETEPNCFIIGQKLQCVPNEDDENMKFWDDIYDTFNVQGPVSCTCSV